jgi:hypothetical protein
VRPSATTKKPEITMSGCSSVLEELCVCVCVSVLRLTKTCGGRKRPHCAYRLKTVSVKYIGPIAEKCRPCRCALAETALVLGAMVTRSETRQTGTGARQPAPLAISRTQLTPTPLLGSLSLHGSSRGSPQEAIDTKKHGKISLLLPCFHKKKYSFEIAILH